MKNKGIFIAATGQNQGKTTTSLAIFRKMLEEYGDLSFMKPVGQRTIELNGESADEDALLMKEVFQLKSNANVMSPVTVPRGFTKDYLDGKRTNESIKNAILNGWKELVANNKPVIVEGTGHAGVGSVFGMNNAQVAKSLDLPVIMIAGGGIGRPLDEFTLNLSIFQQEGVKVEGVIFNKTDIQKKDQVEKYCSIFLDKLGISCLGVIEYNNILENPSLRRLQLDLNAKILSGEKNLDVVPLKILAGAGVLDYILNKTFNQTVVVTPASRSDVIIAAAHNYSLSKLGKNKTQSEFIGVILTGDQDPHPDVLVNAQQSDIPILRTKLDTYEAVEFIDNSLGKTLSSDKEKLDIINDIYNKSIKWDQIIDIIERR
jgi:BioD-like phosphotransacetylase family protein